MSDPLRHEHALTIPPECDGLRLDQALATLLQQYSRSAIKQWIEAGDAALNGAPARPRTTVHGGDTVTLHAHLEGSVGLPAQAVAFDTVYADEALLVVNKPAGLVVHPGAGNRDLTLVNGLLMRYPELAALPRAGLVHRIDKDTSGLLLVARSTASYQSLVRAMAAREVSRHYDAVVTGVLLSGGTIDAPIGRDPRQRTRMRVTAGGRDAVTHYRIAGRYRAHTLLRVHLETGRTHQIRVHLAARGHALVGDTRYGARPRPPPAPSSALLAALESFPRQALHAASLAFEHPLRHETLSFDAPRPSDIATLIAALEADFEAARAAPS